MAEHELTILVAAKGAAQAAAQIGRVGAAVAGTAARSRAVAVGLGVGLERIAEFGISQLGNGIRDGIASLQELERVQGQTAAAIQSTGGVAGVTAQQIRDMAEAQEDLTTVDDKVVQSGENLLLTFTGIHKDVFPRATAAMVDMAVAMNNGDASTV